MVTYVILAIVMIKDSFRAFSPKMYFLAKRNYPPKEGCDVGGLWKAAYCWNGLNSEVEIHKK